MAPFGKAQAAVRAGTVALIIGAGIAFAQSQETIFSSDMDGTKRASPATMGALEVRPTNALPGAPGLTIARK